MVKLDHYNRTRYKDFYMGPKVKSALTILDAFPNQKNGGNFFCGKKGQTGGSRGGLSLGHTFSRLSFFNSSLSSLSTVAQGDDSVSTQAKVTLSLHVCIKCV